MTVDLTDAEKRALEDIRRNNGTMLEPESGDARMTEQITTITYSTFFNLTPNGPRFISHVYENGKAFPIYFQGDTDTQALERAQKWAQENAMTPERQARIAANRIAAAERLNKARTLRSIKT